MFEHKPDAFIWNNSMNESNTFGKCNLSIGAIAIESCKETHFENRKRRPHERGKKKPKKGTRNPTELLWNGLQAKNCISTFPAD